MITHFRRTKHMMLCGLDSSIWPAVFGVTQQWHNWRKLVNCDECLRLLTTIGLDNGESRAIIDSERSEE